MKFQPQKRQFEPYIDDNGVAHIALTRDLETILDACDLPKVIDRPWYAKTGDKGGYYAACANPEGGAHIRMHRFLMGVTDPDIQVDHLNGSPLDNRRIANLRIATQSQNSHNGKLRKNNTSGHIGVRWHVGAQKWSAQITVDRKAIHLGLFRGIEEAGAAYDEASLKHFGMLPVQRV